MTPRLQALITAEPGHVLSADDWAGLSLINAEPARGSKLDALVVLKGAPDSDAESYLAWARRLGLRIFDLRAHGEPGSA